MRAEQNGGAVSGRLDHVLSAALAVQTAAHERDIGQAPDGAQLADRVKQNDRRFDMRLRQLAAAHEFLAGGLQKVRYLLKAVFLPGDNDEPQVGMSRPQLAI